MAMDAVTPLALRMIGLMLTRLMASFAFTVGAAFAITACAPLNGGARSGLASCDDVIPTEVIADVLGSEDGRLIQLRGTEGEPDSPLVEEMVNDGIACGGSIDGDVVLDGTVLLGQLRMDEDRWDSIRADFADDTQDASDDYGIPGWVDVAQADPQIPDGSGFAWKGGVLFYATSPLLLGFAPAFDS